MDAEIYMKKRDNIDMFNVLKFFLEDQYFSNYRNITFFGDLTDLERLKLKSMCLRLDIKPKQELTKNKSFETYTEWKSKQKFIEIQW